MANQKHLRTTIFLMTLFLPTLILKAQELSNSKRCQKIRQAHIFNLFDDEILLQENGGGKITMVNTNVKYSKRKLRSLCSGIKSEIVTLKDSICAFNSNKDIFNYQTIGYHSRFEIRRKLRKNKIFVIDSIPEEYKKQDYEINLIYTHKKRNCYRLTFHGTAGYENIPLSYNLHTQNIADDFIKKHLKTYQPIKEKREYKVFFKKNKTEFDTLKLIKSIIKDSIDTKSVYKITINAYASVEGQKQHNDSLAQKRGYMILNTLRSTGYHCNSVILNTDINWELFYDQIESERFRVLKQLDQNEIRKKISNDTSLYASLKNKLDSQRIARVIIEYTVLPFSKESAEKLQTSLHSLIDKKQYENAEQKLIELFGKVFYNSANKNYIQSLNFEHIEKVTETDKTAKQLLLTLQYLKHLLNPKPQYYSLEKLNSLLRVNPVDYDLLYYKTDMSKAKFYSDDKKFIPEIRKLKKYPISRTDINKLLARYYTGAAHFEFVALNYRKKKAYSKTLYSLLKRTKLTGRDIVTGANVLNHFHENDLAVKLLNPYIRHNDYDEEMLFAYLSFILPYPEYTHKRNFTMLAKKAVEMDKERFLNFFKPINKGGLSFQILQDEILYNFYCMIK